MKQGIIYTLVVIAIAIAAFAGGWLYRGTKTPPPGATPGGADTLIIRDTIRPKAEVIIRRKVDSIPYPVPFAVHDTIYLPREQIVASGEDFTAWISGFQPQLDSIEIYPPTMIITEPVEVPVIKRWSVGVHAGLGIAATNTGIQPCPYVGVGVSYSLFSW